MIVVYKHTSSTLATAFYIFLSQPLLLVFSVSSIDSELHEVEIFGCVHWRLDDPELCDDPTGDEIGRGNIERRVPDGNA